MSANSLRLRTALPADMCRQRISRAKSGRTSSSLGWDLLSVVEVVDLGDSFELRHKVEPVIFRGNICSCDGGCEISGEMQVPAQGFYRFAVALALLIGTMVVGATIYDLITGAHLLHTRRYTELGPGHPASFDAHVVVLVTVPPMIALIFLLWYPRIGGVSKDVQQAFIETLQALFESPDPVHEAENES